MTIRKSVLQYGLATLAAAIVLFGVSFAVAQADSKSKADNPRILGSTLEVHIGDNGNVLVRGAKVTAVNGTTISAQASFGSTNVNFTVQTNSNTQFLMNRGGQQTLADVKVGDYISFTGPLVQSAASLTVDAKVVKDYSHPNTAFTIKGTVTSVSTTANTIVVSTGSATTTLQLAAGASIKINGATAGIADIKTGDKLSASGTLSASGVYTADKVVIGDRPVVKNDDKKDDDRKEIRKDVKEFRADIREKINNWFSAFLKNH